MAKKTSYSYKARRSDTLTNRMMTVFVLLLISVFVLLYIKSWLNSPGALDSYEAYMKIVRYIPILPFVFFALSAFYLYRCKAARKDESLKTFSSLFLFCISIVLLVVSLLISNNIYNGYVPSVILIIIISLLYFISVSFPGAYLVMTAFNALAAFTIYAFSLFSPIDSKFEHFSLRTVAVIVALFFGAMLVISKKNSGTVWGIRILPKNADYLPVFIAVALFIIFVILGMFQIGSYVIYDAIIALETIIFLLFYAVKMLK